MTVARLGQHGEGLPPALSLRGPFPVEVVAKIELSPEYKLEMSRRIAEAGGEAL